MSDMQQNGHNSNRLLPLGVKVDRGVADDEMFLFSFQYTRFLFIIDAIISSTKTGGNLRIETNMC